MSEHKYLRDPRNEGVLLNTDTDSLKAYKARREALRSKDGEIQQLETRLNRLEEMLAQLMEK